MDRYHHFIAGRWVDPVSGEWFDTFDPSTGAVLASLPRGSAVDIDHAVDAAGVAFTTWGFYDAVERGRLLMRVSQRILENLERLAYLESTDTGKPLTQARADVTIAARYFEFYAGAADKFGGSTIPVPGTFLDYTLREPLGVVANIIPWNYPLQIGARAIAAPLAVGNTVVLKPAEEASLSVLELAQMVRDVGIPEGVVNVVAGLGDEAGAPLAAHPKIQHLTFTGSLAVGRKVARSAADTIVPVTLELGGKSPHVVFATADLERAVPIIVRSFLQNAGQTCSAGSRILVEASIKRTLVERLVDALTSVRIGPGTSDPDLGPIISPKQKARVEHYVELAQSRGARAYAGSTPPIGSGYYVSPMILDGVEPDSPVFHEEIFGPVASVTPFSSEAEALTLANATEYGLVAAIWTQDVGQAHRMARRVHAGQVFINSYGAGGGVEMPFGGYGHSGYGREKGWEALYHYTQVKNVAVYTGP